MNVTGELMAPLDGLLVEQALVNLLENAAKYAGPGPQSKSMRAPKDQSS